MTVITKPSFIVNLIILEEVLLIIDILSTGLQKKIILPVYLKV